MTVNCLWELQKAVFTALNGDSTLAAMINGVFSHVPQNTALPYISFGDIRAEDWSTKTSNGIKSSVELNIFSDSRGSKEALLIMIEIKRILDGAALSMTGCTMVSMEFVSTSISQQNDGVSWQGSIVFNALVQE